MAMIGDGGAGGGDRARAKKVERARAVSLDRRPAETRGEGPEAVTDFKPGEAGVVQDTSWWLKPACECPSCRRVDLVQVPGTFRARLVVILLAAISRQLNHSQHARRL